MNIVELIQGVYTLYFHVSELQTKLSNQQSNKQSNKKSDIQSNKTSNKTSKDGAKECRHSPNNTIGTALYIWLGGYGPSLWAPD